jgi:hypothetical protein
VKLAICTPVYGHPSYASVSLMYLNGLFRWAKDPSVEVLTHRMFVNCDLVRARSRAVRMVLDADHTHLLFWDADVGGPGVAECLRGMIDQGKDFIAAEYPRKLYRPGNRTVPTHETSGHVGMGFTLLARSVLERVTAAHPELEFTDFVDGQPYPSSSVFMLMLRGGRLLGEDYSFCQRWQDLGGVVWLYDGPGAPLEHVGGHVYR